MSKVMYGWYSHKMREVGGASVYLSCGEEPKKKVVVTAVTDGPKHGTMYDDVFPCGLVSKWIRRLDYGLAGKP